MKIQNFKSASIKVAAVAAISAFALTTGVAAQAAEVSSPKTAVIKTAAAKDVVVTQAWVRASSFSDHTGGMTGMFAKITNRTKKTVTLTGGSSSFAPMVQVHEVVDGMMREKSGGIKIAPGKSVMLQPGGLHVMLMGLTKEVKPGTVVDVKLNFTNAKSVSLKLISKPADAGDETYFSGKK